MFRFLGIDETFWSDAFVGEENIRRSRRRTLLGIGVWKAGEALLGGRRMYSLERRAPALIQAVLTRPLRQPMLDDTLRRKLEGVFRHDVARLRKLTGLPLADWSV